MKTAIALISAALLLSTGCRSQRADSAVVNLDVKAVPLAPSPTGEEVTHEDMVAINHTFRDSFDHAGGIVSAALDGLRIAERIAERFG